MKQLTLEISERQEQEELSEALQQLQRVTLGEQIQYSVNRNIPSQFVWNLGIRGRGLDNLYKFEQLTKTFQVLVISIFNLQEALGTASTDTTRELRTQTSSSGRSIERTLDLDRRELLLLMLF